MASKPKAAAAAKPAPTPLPKSLLAALPVASEIVKHADAIEKLIPKLEKELAAAKKRGAIDLARSFTVLHRLVTTVDAKVKGVGSAFEHYKTLELPAIFEQAGITNVPLAEGFRVGVAYLMRASINSKRKEDAYAWVRKEFPDLLSETINASSLSSLARDMLENQNKELPQDLFNVVNLPITSVTAVK